MKSIYCNLKKARVLVNKIGIIKFVNKFLNSIVNKKNFSYNKLCREYDVTLNDIVVQENYCFVYNPKISIIVPVYNTKKQFLIDMLESVINQTYKNFEICIYDGNSTNEETTNTLKEYILKYKNIKVEFGKKNYGISENTNKALKLASGEYSALLDHDDLLTKDALFQVVKAINDHNPDIIYSDEDKISEDKSCRLCPHFKPDWSPDLLRSYNYICHFFVFKRTLLNDVGLFREEFDGSQDYDFILRLTEHTNNIYHIPKVLYHWRVSQFSTADNILNKSYAIDAGKKALKQHLQRNNIEGNIDYSLYSSSYQIKLSESNKPISKVTLLLKFNKKNKLLIKKTINKLLETCGYNNIDIIVFSQKVNIKELRVKFIENISFEQYLNYIEENNELFGEYILVVDDLFIRKISHDWLLKMILQFKYKSTDIINPKINDFKFKKSLNLGIQNDIFKKLYNKGSIYSLGYMSRNVICQNIFSLDKRFFITKKNVFIHLIKQGFFIKKECISDSDLNITFYPEIESNI